ncbi:Ldh family oxidoreductase [Actinophytocola algeriensis]|uniref:Putative oxidoreductase n=1 Tax=Actinophytocola algeriensis TaxID=1768010 RepID=A0A7W7PZX6_9PSEU|nr:Ldh family oxidoreductase [Actinophytocola algeriensis]MBB4904324.1 putative oxidoreductase [Actinophytocola algeriensis]MBE1476818.1 putative oxidoreductase [Actinophytocola algeriensis]
MRMVSGDELLGVAVAALRAVGVPEASATAVAGSLVRSNLVGHDSHGVRRLVQYAGDVRGGKVDPLAVPEAERTRPGTVVVHGRRAFGQLAAGRAVTELLDARHGSGVAVIRDCNHVGRLGEYVAELAGHDLVAMAFGNADPTVAPFGGRERRLGTNPLAWAVPRAKGKPPVVMDWATSVVAEGKLAVARDRREPVAEGLVLDADGRATTDPGDFYRGGVLLPFGGHKGYGLSVLIEIVGGLLTGTGIGSMPGYTGDFGTVLVAFAIDAFQPADEFRAHTEEFCRALNETPPAQGHHEVLVPGEPEERTRVQRERDGIPIPDSTWQELHALHEE